MNDAVKVPADGMLRTADLAAHPDFTLGLAIVSPSTRTIAGPGGTQDVEPRVMQVLILLANAAGQVVTRETLFERCWGGVYVGDDSLNRAIAEVRKLAAGVAGGSFEIETIPRTGYRLVGAEPKSVGPSRDGAVSRGWSRRELASGVAGLVALGGIGTWAMFVQHRFDALMQQGAEAISDANKFDPGLAKRALERAVRLRPDSASAWGWLAYVRSVLVAGARPKDAAAAVDAAQFAARRALALNPREPNGLLAMFELEGSTLDWFTRDRRLRQIIAIDPANTNAIGELVLLLQAAGLNRESRNWNERAIELQPLSQDFLSKRALKLWIAGRVSEADKVIDQLRGLYPASPWPWFVRFFIYALTSRPRAAQAMLEANPGMIPDPVEASIWRTALAALAQPSPAAVARVRLACFKGSETIDQVRGESVMILSALADVDAAFDVANGYLLGRGPIIRRDQPDSNAPAQDAVGRINMQWLFTPPCAVMRSDPRFLPLCEGIGLTEYWRRRGVKPDYLSTG